MNRSRRRPALFLSASLAVSAHVAAASLPAAHAQTPPVGVTAPASPPAAALQADALSIGPGLFTFPQIAAFLSTPEQPITCDFSMKDRAAFVFLQSRSRVELKYLLGAGLQVEFSPAPPPASSDTKDKGKPGGLVMTRQKAVSEREAVWLKRLARIVQTEFQRKAGEVASYDNKPLPDFNKITKLIEESRALNNENDDLDAPPKNEAIAQKRAQAERLNTALHAEESLPKASERLLAAWARANTASLVSLLQNRPDGSISQSIPPQFYRNGWAAQAVMDGLSVPTAIHLTSLPPEFRAENYAWAARYTISSLLYPELEISVEGRFSHLHTAASVSAYAEARKTLGRRDTASELEKENATAIYYLNNSFSYYLSTRIPEDYASVPEGMPPALFLLGSDAIAWWNQEKADTGPNLQKLPIDAPAPPSSSPEVKSPVLGGEVLVGQAYTDGSFTLSDAAQYFSVKNKAEMVMELHPRFERLQTQSKSPSLSAWVTQKGTAEQWSVREKNKVWLITNRLSFMERPQNTPFSELLQLRSDLQQWHEENDTSLAALPTKAQREISTNYLPYSPLSVYARAVMARRDGRTWKAETNNAADLYHGIHLEFLDRSVPVLYLWSKLSDSERNKIIAGLTPLHEGDNRVLVNLYPLSRVSGATLSNVAQFMGELGQWGAGSQAFVNPLRSYNLRVVLLQDPRFNIPKYQRFSVTLYAGSEITDFGITAEARFLFPLTPSQKSAP